MHGACAACLHRHCPMYWPPLLTHCPLRYRAAKKLLPGEEVTVNYLGRAVLAPAESRREELQGVYGFRCKCPRCK